MKKIKLEEIKDKIKSLTLTESFDLVVGIAEGGIVPAYIVSRHMGKPLEFIWLKMRDKDHKKITDTPQLVRPIDFDFKGKSILIVDDRANTGLTLETAKAHLSEAKEIKTLAVSGKADYSLYEGECFDFPWNI